MDAKQKKGDVQAFERRSATYEGSARQGLFFDRVQKTVLDLVQNGDKVASILDVGCGTGRLLRKAQERWSKVRLFGVDPAEGMIEKARQLLPEARFYVGRAESLPLPDDSVDVVLSTSSFHHWVDQAAGVREIARVLREDGRVILADIVIPKGLSWIIHHFARNNPVKTREMFVQAGLKIEAQNRRMARLLVITVGKKATS